MPITIALINRKGGVGRTTLTANLATEFACWGNKVLMIDACTNLDLTIALNTEQKESYLDDTDALIDELLVYPKQVNELLAPPGQNTETPSRLALLPAGSGLLATTSAWQDGIKYKALSLTIAAIKTKFDVILIDCPADFSTITKNAIAAATHILLPTKLDAFSVRGVYHSLVYISEFISSYNKQLKTTGQTSEVISPKILGVVAMMVQTHDYIELISIQRDFMDKLKQEFPYNTYIFSNTSRLNDSLFADWKGVPAVCADYKGDAQQEAVFELKRIAKEVTEQIIGKPFERDQYRYKFSSE